MDQPWFRLPEAPPSDRREAVVVGAGMAGAAVAYSLSKRGFQVRLLERSDRPAGETSNHPSAVVLPIIALEAAPVSQYHVAAYRMALARIETLNRSGDLPSWRPRGVVHLLRRERLAKIYEQIERTRLPEDVLSRLTADEADRVTGLDLHKPALFYPLGGDLNPPEMVRAQIDRPGIDFQPEAGVARIHREGDQWHLWDSDDRLLAKTSLLVLASAYDVTRLPQTDWFPLIRIRGQLAYLPVSAFRERPKVVICHDGYMIPDVAGRHIVGATFDYNDDNADLSEVSHRALLAKLDDLLTPVEPLDTLPMQGRVAFRAKCRDHLPMLGPVPDYDAYMRDYHDITKGRQYKQYPPARYLPGLYVSVGHGSRGTISSILAGEWLAAHLCGESLPLTPEVNQAVHPARFIVRRLLRRKPPLRPVRD
ncbi:FAD-dependent 5-carboxymethylaminomethyl-2-thiouridine(34) oxidoreductase MnmC [Sulfidibacter corallicola]|uniref:FAD-dependent 5-carboxymethylaminomethyl-2-thiouridine(34) oxidoreductase MnmC n=1 Tax=Sulfidibacter corallicola TaxID=2818388 RepID=A0A8A4TPP5_SULCO|nr:FAD-dependent 5-carboxymethylaminomethyl-2-thiouridine(34) oxidoreductase MnmC [Sulfidibacter corallicola]QTD51052.1 FAD-dependent 5-carboxymethylaminomethyl-2-thiouridine(34) oxidoreductase MnmC [Sulfidibacter corallicola]